MAAPRATRGQRGGTPRPSFGDSRSRGGIRILGLNELRARTRMIRRLLASKPFRPRSDQQRLIRAATMRGWGRAWASGGATLAGYVQGKAPWAPHDLVELGKLRDAAVHGKPMPKVRRDGSGTVYITVRAYSAQWARRWGEYLGLDATAAHEVGVIYAADLADRIAGIWGGVRGRS